jgi:hypothetical protein
MRRVVNTVGTSTDADQQFTVRAGMIYNFVLCAPSVNDARADGPPPQSYDQWHLPAGLSRTVGRAVTRALSFNVSRFFLAEGNIKVTHAGHGFADSKYVLQSR